MHVCIGWKDGTKITLSNEGDDVHPGVVTPADIVFTIQTKPHPRFEREDYDLIHNVSVCVEDMCICVYVCVLRICVCVYVYMLRTCVCVYVCVLRICVCEYICVLRTCVCVYVCVLRICVCVYVCLI